ncbi:MAG TPA: 2-C-methyl-D-erythritol 4-phosphate cytidylyltransferase [bacterium]|nr:2-C-methyl-D-erythritol 4-phosphate cytidylyltransferase [bacterium]HOL34714.1 2-C-methyl-D-erythritol 4-phosphate cytidylyltransferase [bacterium]HPP08033.1 2-C-methyl-D-erythritol 4-phosphate cytidylyltransferase [bacterium]
MTGCVIVAAGRGNRFKSKVPKILFNLAGMPVVEYSLKTFSVCPLIDEIVLVVNKQIMETDYITKWTGKFPKIKKVVPGGMSREESVLNGISQCSARCDTILVHDGARPFVTESLIASVINGAQAHGACIPAYPINGSVKLVKGNKLVSTIFETELQVAQTPQGFKREILEKVFQIYRNELDKYPDESSMCEQSGISVRVVPGEITNIKITTHDDIKIALSLLNNSM